MRPEAGHSMMASRSSTPGRATRTMRRALPDQRWLGLNAHVGHACRAIEHPGRNLERPRYIRAVQCATEDAIGPLGRAVNKNVAPEPGMKPIKKLSAHRPVGVLKPCCTIIGARIRALTGARRTRPTSHHRRSRRRHEFSAARRTCLRSGYALPPSRPAREIAKDQPRQQST